jgi:hypothetical protein
MALIMAVNRLILTPQTNFALNLAASYQAFPLLALGVGPAAQLVTCTFLVALVDFAQQRGGLEVPAPTL